MKPVIYPQSSGLGKHQLTHGGKESPSPRAQIASCQNKQQQAHCIVEEIIMEGDARKSSYLKY